MKYITIMILLLLLNGCGVVDKIIKPRPYGLGETPEGSPTFQLGWEDGCNSGMHVYGNARYRAAYKFKQELSLISNAEYYRAWKDAYIYCRWYTWNWVRPFMK